MGEHYALFVRGQFELRDSPVHIGYFVRFAQRRPLAVAVFGCPYLSVRQVSYFLASVEPYCIRIIRLVFCQLCAARAVRIHHEDFAVAPVLGDSRITHRVQYLASVRRYFRSGYFRKGYKDFRGHFTVCNLDSAFAYNALFFRRGGATNRQGSHGYKRFCKEMVHY